MFEVEGKGIMTSTISSTNTAVSLPGLIASLHATVDAIVAADPSGESLDELAGAIEQLHRGARWMRGDATAGRL